MDQESDDLNKDPQEENEYYYVENGLIVFKAAFLLKRGYCCKRGCRHCPYGFREDLPGERSPSEE